MGKEMYLSVVLVKTSGYLRYRFKSYRRNEADFVTALFYGSKQKLKSRAKHCATQMPGDVRSTHPVPAHFRDKWERDVMAV